MSGHNRRQIGRRTFYVSAVGALILDQVTKAVARSTLDLGEVVGIVPGLFYLRLTQNPGAAFGALGSWPPALILIGFIAVFAILGLRKERARSNLLAASLGLLLAGTLGNLIDRIRFGSVTDFLDFTATIYGRVFNWPTFNIADVAITAGVSFLVYYTLFVDKGTPEKKTAEVSRSNN